MKKTISLVLGGGAPNLTLMAGAVAGLDDAGVEFDVVSTSGAGMLIGLLYAAPKGRDRAARHMRCTKSCPLYPQ
jgi:predicted acylesterase/phospholipase RssA